MGEGRLLFNVGENGNQFRPGKSLQMFFKELQMTLPSESTVLLLGIQWWKSNPVWHVVTLTSMFIAVQIPGVETCNWPR